ncbi:hypothetical protein VPH35_034739 [Triticum aestivum]
MKSTVLALLLLVAVQCLALGSRTAAAAKVRRTRQGDYLNRLRGSPSSRASWESLAAVEEEQTTTKATGRPAPAAVAAEAGRKEADRVEALPGQPSGVDFAQYAGYVTVDAAAGRALFYYLAEAVGGNGDGSSSKGKPLLLWLNGGSGCSSLGYGAMEELGPFRVMSDGKTLYRNPYSWKAGSTRRTGDNRTAEDAYLFLANWLERFPEYKGREFYITGESYAGHYVPQLAHAILRHASPAINLKGIMIGNAVINDWTDSKGMYDFFWTHALISDETAEGISKNCNFTAGAASNALCDDASDAAGESLRDIDIYNIYAPNCQSEKLVTPPIAPSIENFDPCTDYYVEAYLNSLPHFFFLEKYRRDFNRADGQWFKCFCSCDVLTRWVDSAKTVLPIIRELMKNNIRVWVYSGDTDGRVPVTSSRLSVNQLQLPVAAKWRPWFSSTKGAERWVDTLCSTRVISAW